MSKSATKNVLLLVDLQNDFLPGGALAVPCGNQVIAVANEWMNKTDFFSEVLATQDWHPQNHKSFASNQPGKKAGDVINLCGQTQVLWPDHCVQGSKGAQLAPGLEVGKIKRVFQKGMDPLVDSYSGFFDNDHQKSTGLAEYLKSIGATDIYIMGLATDYCVKHTVLDCCRLGFGVHLIVEGCRGINLNPNDVNEALLQMQQAGARLVSSSDQLR